LPRKSVFCLPQTLKSDCEPADSLYSVTCRRRTFCRGFRRLHK